jgi:hypothetical protein
MKRKALIALALTLVIFALGVFAAWAYADAVVSVVGAYGAPTGSYTGTAMAASRVTGAPDQGFIQLADNTEITLHIGPCVSVDANASTSDLVIDTYDQPYPAAAKVEASHDGSSWVEVSGRALNDCDLTRQYVFDDVCPGLTPGDPTPSGGCQAHIDLTSTGLGLVCYLRMTDYPGSIDGEFTFPTLGFDLDAVHEGHQLFQDCQPVTVVEVDIDIKPGSDPNCFNNDGHGVIPLAILGSETLDVTSIDPASVQLEGLAVRMVGKSDKLLAHVEDVNGDGFYDLVVQIEDVDGVWMAGTTLATVTGSFWDGTLIEGQDYVCITQ